MKIKSFKTRNARQSLARSPLGIALSWPWLGPPPPIAIKKSFVKNGHAVFEIWSRTNRQTYRQSHRRTYHRFVGEIT